MAYVPDPTDASQPTGDVYAATAAPEFRALKARVNGLAAVIGSSGIAGAALSGHTAVAYNSGGFLVPADSSDADHFGNITGIIVSAVSSGATVDVIRHDVITHVGWAWTPNQPIYAGLAGALVQTVPVSALFTTVVGYALSTTTISVFVQPAILKP